MNRRLITAVVKKCKKGDGKEGKPWCLYTKDGSRLLGAHESKKAAYEQEAAIKAQGMVTAGKHDVIMKVLKAAEDDKRRADPRGPPGVTTEGVMRHMDLSTLKLPKRIEKLRGLQKSREIKKAQRAKVSSMLRSAMKAGLVGGYSSKTKRKSRKGGSLLQKVSVWWTKKGTDANVIATLEAVSQELDDRGDPDLANEVDRVAFDIGTPADIQEDEFEEELNELGFTGDVLTRREDVADQIYQERIPHFDPTLYDSR